MFNWSVTLIGFVQTRTVNKVGLVLLASCFFLKEFIRYFPATLEKDMSFISTNKSMPGMISEIIDNRDNNNLPHC
jgi:hypothetical protein